MFTDQSEVYDISKMIGTKCLVSVNKMTKHKYLITLQNCQLRYFRDQSSKVSIDFEGDNEEAEYIWHLIIDN